MRNVDRARHVAPGIRRGTARVDAARSPGRVASASCTSAQSVSKRNRPWNRASASAGLAAGTSDTRLVMERLLSSRSAIVAAARPAGEWQKRQYVVRIRQPPCAPHAGIPASSPCSPTTASAPSSSASPSRSSACRDPNSRFPGTASPWSAPTAGRFARPEASRCARRPRSERSRARGPSSCPAGGTAPRSPPPRLLAALRRAHARGARLRLDLLRRLRPGRDGSARRPPRDDALAIRRRPGEAISVDPGRSERPLRRRGKPPDFGRQCGGDRRLPPSRRPRLRLARGERRRPAPRRDAAPRGRPVAVHPLAGGRASRAGAVRRDGVGARPSRGAICASVTSRAARR